MTGEIEVGLVDLGTHAGPFLFPAPGRGLVHTLVSGKTGSGKSSTIARLLNGLCELENIAFVGLDHKEGLELFPYSDRFTVVSDNTETSLDVAQSVLELITARGKLIREVSKKEGRTIRAWENRMGPRVVFVIDEAKEVTGNKELVTAVDSIAARGRALGINMIVATQYALAKDFPSTFLVNMAHRVAHRMGTINQYATALAVEAAELNAAGIEGISEHMPGTCYVTGLPGLPDLSRCRSTFVDDFEIDAQVRRTAHLKWEWDRVFTVASVDEVVSYDRDAA